MATYEIWCFNHIGLTQLCLENQSSTDKKKIDVFFN